MYEVSGDGRCFILHQRAVNEALPAAEPILAILPPHNSLEPEEQIANARWIVTAVNAYADMLAALKAAERHFSRLCRDPAHYPCARTLWEQMSAAIAKAKGGGE